MQTFMNEGKKLRIGLLIDDFDIPFWAYNMIKSISLSEYGEIVLIVKNKSAVAKKNIFSRVRNNFNYIAYQLYRKLEDRFFKSSPDAFACEDVRPLIEKVEVIEVECIKKKFSDYLQEKDIERINEFSVDVFIRLGFRILRGNILKAAKFGVWSYHHGDNFVNRGGPAGFWEVFQRERELGSILQILTEDLDGGVVLYRSWSSMQRLLNRSLNGYYLKSSLFIPRKLKELHKLGGEAFLQKINAENGQLHFYSNELKLIPDNAKFLRLFLSYYWDWFNLNIWKLFNQEQWILLYAFSKKSLSTSIFRYKRLTPPKDRFWADPCVIFKDDKYFIFLEELIYKEGKGHLSVMEMDKKGVYSVAKVILKKPYHLSYPFVFDHEGEYYMIPESEENSTIQLYHSVKFPYEWEFKMNLMENVKAVDTTIFVKDNKFWMFTNIIEINGSPFSDELYLFSSDNLFSTTWESHPSNPIVSDVKSARPAGKLFFHNEKLYRPSQDCSYKYGYSTVINEVLVFNENEYKETRITEILPKWAKDVAATHTLSFDENLSVIDAAITRNKFF